MKDDGMMSDLDPRIEAALKASSPPILMALLIADCGCRVGRVTKSGSQNLLILNSANIVTVSAEVTEYRRQGSVFLLSDPQGAPHIGCKHRQGHPVDLDVVRAHVAEIEAGRRRRGVPVLLTTRG